MSLPTYDEAVVRPEVLSVLANFLDANSLAIVTRVSRAWYRIANPFLWADPIGIVSQLGNPFLNFKKFITRLKEIDSGRSSNTRDLVITLNFRPLLALKHHPVYRQHYAQFEELVTTQWAFQKAAYLHNLRFIMVDGLRVLEDSPPFWRDGDGRPRPEQVLLLSASGVRGLNSTWIAVDVAFHNLMFLDISYTTRTEDFTRVYSAYGLPNLRVLKLRGLRLTNAHLPRAVCNRHRLWSLDVRDNLLTDEIAEILLQHFILPPITQPNTNTLASNDTGLFENPPAYERESRSGSQPLSTVPLRPDGKFEFMEHVKLHGNFTYLGSALLDETDDMLRPTGLTQLYISGNKLTSLGINRLLHQANRLQVLDAGSVRAASAAGINIPYTIPLAQINSVPRLGSQGGTRLQALRIHHSVVTYTPTMIPLNSSGYRLQDLHKAEMEFASRQAADWEAFSPHSNYRIRYLCLTDIPTKSYGPILNRLKEFITSCEAQQRQLETAATGIGAAHPRGPRLLSGLRTLRLEFIVENCSEIGISASEDRDADEFLAQSMGDFSFFEPPDTPLAAKAPIPKAFDVVEHLREFRRTMVCRWHGKLELVAPR